MTKTFCDVQLAGPLTKHDESLAFEEVHVSLVRVRHVTYRWPGIWPAGGGFLVMLIRFSSD